MRPNLDSILAPCRTWALITIPVLAVASLACGNVPERPDSQATVQAFYATITAQAAGSPFPTGDVTQAPASTDRPATNRPTLTPSITPTPPDARTGLGEFSTIRRCPINIDIQIDGSANEWEQINAAEIVLDEPSFGEDEWLGDTDLSGRAHVCWAETGLFILIRVTDDVLVQNEVGLTSWRGDEIEFFFDGDLRGDYYDVSYNGDDSQLGLSPGNFDTIAPNAVMYRPDQEKLDADRLLLAARRDVGSGANYVLEAAIPWSLLRTVPQTNTNYGMCIALNDNDHVGISQQDTMVGNCSELETPDPTTFATVRFE
jgi:hypothetical protein